MNITAFNPLIISPKAADIVALFDSFGFKCKHVKEGINGDIINVDLKSVDGFRVDVAQVDQMPQDMTVIRMTVDNFDEAYEFLTARGFKNTQGDKVTETNSSKATLMISPSGFGISLAQHIKKQK